VSKVSDSRRALFPEKAGTMCHAVNVLQLSVVVVVVVVFVFIVVVVIVIVVVVVVTTLCIEIDMVA
jgi:hypothetical protein